MKKLICLLLSVVMVLGLCACGPDNGPGDVQNPGEAVTVTEGDTKYLTTGIILGAN